MSEKYPTKRAYANPKLRNFLVKEGLYEEFIFNCKNYSENKSRFNKDLWTAFSWNRTAEGYIFWELLAEEFDEQT